MENRFLFFWDLILISCFFSCTTAKVINNTFLSEIENKSNFSITIDDETVLSGAKVQHHFPVYNDGVHQTDVNYEIMLTENVSYILKKEKILIANNQKKVTITNPKSIDLPECYVIIQNDSDKTIQITDERNNPSFKCYKEGIINSTASSIKNITANSKAVCEIKQSDGLYVSDNQLATMVKLIKLDTPYKNGYIYTVSVQDEKITLIDFRPLLNLGEKSWQKEYKENEIIKSILQKGEYIYLLGQLKENTQKNSKYRTNRLHCFNLQGTDLWEKAARIIDIKNADTDMYDMAFGSNGSVYVVGQCIETKKHNIPADDKKLGIICEYDLDGNFQQKHFVPEVSGLDMIMPCSDGTFIVTGADVKDTNKNIYFNFNQIDSYKETNPVWTLSEVSTQFQNQIQSESKFIKDKNGNIYIAGETARFEDRRSCSAKVIRIFKDGKIEPVYTARESFSFVSDMVLDEEQNQLIMVGHLNANDDVGNGGTPFIRCLDLNTKNILWESLYTNCGYESCANIVKCENYGFILHLVNVSINKDGEGEISLPCKIIRTNATGKLL